MRVHVCAVQMTLHRADVLEAYLNGQDNIQKATVYCCHLLQTVLHTGEIFQSSCYGVVADAVDVGSQAGSQLVVDVVLPWLSLACLS